MFLLSSRYAGALALALLLVGGPAPMRANADGLSLAESERIAVERDAMLREMRAQGAAMRERAVMDGELMDPQLRLGAVNVPVDSFSLDEEDMTMLEVGVVQEFQPGDSRRLSRKQMVQLASAMDATALDRERIVRREVRKLWTQLAYIGSARSCSTSRRAGSSRCGSRRGRVMRPAKAGSSMCCKPGWMPRCCASSSSTSTATTPCTGRSCRSGSARRSRARAAFRPAPRPELEPLATLEARVTAHPAQLDYEHRIDAAATGEDVAREGRKPAWMLDVSYGLRGRTDDGRQVAPDMLSAMVTVGLPLFGGDRQDRDVRRRTSRHAACTRCTQITSAKCRQCSQRPGARRAYGRTRTVLRDGAVAARRAVGARPRCSGAVEPHHVRRSGVGAAGRPGDEDQASAAGRRPRAGAARNRLSRRGRTMNTVLRPHRWLALLHDGHPCSRAVRGSQRANRGAAGGRHRRPNTRSSTRTRGIDARCIRTSCATRLASARSAAWSS